MPELDKIYAALIDDPDVIPPKNVSKEDYALMLAQQRVQQYNNNEKALNLGLTKLLKHTNGHSNGHSSNGNGHSSSAVDQLSEFLVKLDDTMMPIDVLIHLWDKRYSDEAIEDIRQNYPYLRIRGVKEFDMFNDLTDSDDSPDRASDDEHETRKIKRPLLQGISSRREDKRDTFRPHNFEDQDGKEYPREVLAKFLRQIKEGHLRDEVLNAHRKGEELKSKPEGAWSRAKRAAEDKKAKSEPSAAAKELGLVRGTGNNSKWLYPKNPAGEADISLSPVHSVKIAGKERFLTSLTGDDFRTWYEYKGTDTPLPKTDEMGLGFAKKDAVKRLEENATLQAKGWTEDEIGDMRSMDRTSYLERLAEGQTKEDIEAEDKKSAEGSQATSDDEALRNEKWSTDEINAMESEQKTFYLDQHARGVTRDEIQAKEAEEAQGDSAPQEEDNQEEDNQEDDPTPLPEITSEKEIDDLSTEDLIRLAEEQGLKGIPENPDQKDIDAIKGILKRDMVPTPKTDTDQESNEDITRGDPAQDEEILNRMFPSGISDKAKAAFQMAFTDDGFKEYIKQVDQTENLDHVLIGDKDKKTQELKEVSVKNVSDYIADLATNSDHPHKAIKDKMLENERYRISMEQENADFKEDASGPDVIDREPIVRPSLEDFVPTGTDPVVTSERTDPEKYKELPDYLKRKYKEILETLSGQTDTSSVETTGTDEDDDSVELPKSMDEIKDLHPNAFANLLYDRGLLDHEAVTGAEKTEENKHVLTQNFLGQGGGGETNPEFRTPYEEELAADLEIENRTKKKESTNYDRQKLNSIINRLATLSEYYNPVDDLSDENKALWVEHMNHLEHNEKYKEEWEAEGATRRSSSANHVERSSPNFKWDGDTELNDFIKDDKDAYEAAYGQTDTSSVATTAADNQDRTDKLIFGTGAIDTAKQYGLLTPDGKYTDLGHSFLELIGGNEGRAYLDAGEALISTDIPQNKIDEYNTAKGEYDTAKAEYDAKVADGSIKDEHEIVTGSKRTVSPEEAAEAEKRLSPEVKQELDVRWEEEKGKEDLATRSGVTIFGAIQENLGEDALKYFKHIAENANMEALKAFRIQNDPAGAARQLEEIEQNKAPEEPREPVSARTRLKSYLASEKNKIEKKKHKKALNDWNAKIAASEAEDLSDSDKQKLIEEAGTKPILTLFSAEENPDDVPSDEKFYRLNTKLLANKNEITNVALLNIIKAINKMPQEVTDGEDVHAQRWSASYDPKTGVLRTDVFRGGNKNEFWGDIDWEHSENLPINPDRFLDTSSVWGSEGVQALLKHALIAGVITDDVGHEDHFQALKDHDRNRAIKTAKESGASPETIEAIHTASEEEGQRQLFDMDAFLDPKTFQGSDKAKEKFIEHVQGEDNFNRLLQKTTLFEHPEGHKGERWSTQRGRKLQELEAHIARINEDDRSEHGWRLSPPPKSVSSAKQLGFDFGDEKEEISEQIANHYKAVHGEEFEANLENGMYHKNDGTLKHATLEEAKEEFPLVEPSGGDEREYEEIPKEIADHYKDVHGDAEYKQNLEKGMYHNEDGTLKYTTLDAAKEAFPPLDEEGKIKLAMINKALKHNGSENETTLVNHILEKEPYEHLDSTGEASSEQLRANLAKLPKDKLAARLTKLHQEYEKKKVVDAKAADDKKAADEKKAAADEKKAAEEAEEASKSENTKAARREMLEHLSELTGDSVEDLDEQYKSEWYSNDDLLTKIKTQHKTDDANKENAKKEAEAAKRRASLAEAESRIDSFQNGDDLRDELQDQGITNEDELKARQTKEARKLLDFWHEHKDAIEDDKGTRLKGIFETKLQAYSDNGADMSLLMAEQQQMEIAEIDRTDPAQVQKWYDEKAYNEKQPQIAEDLHRERLAEALSHGHHNRITEHSDTGEPRSGYIHLKGNSHEFVPSDEAGIEHYDEHYEHAPQLAHHKANGDLDDVAQELYQKVHTARQGMPSEMQKHVSKLAAADTAHEARISDITSKHEEARKVRDRQHRANVADSLAQHDKEFKELEEHEETWKNETSRFDRAAADIKARHDENAAYIKDRHNKKAQKINDDHDKKDESLDAFITPEDSRRRALDENETSRTNALDENWTSRNDALEKNEEPRERIREDIIGKLNERRESRGEAPHKENASLVTAVASEYPAIERQKTKLIDDSESAHTTANNEADDDLATATEDSKETRDAAREQISDELPEEADRTGVKETEEAEKAFKEHMAGNAATATAALSHERLGMNAELAKTGHANAAQEGEAPEDDRDGTKGQTRQVQDSNGKMKTQIWIPGQGKGWCDKDKVDEALDGNADAANDTSIDTPNGKVVIYPPGHFNSDGDHGDEPSKAMVGYGGNLHALEDEHVPHTDPSVSGFGRDQYIGNHLRGKLNELGHDFDGGVQTMDASKLDLDISNTGFPAGHKSGEGRSLQDTSRNLWGKESEEAQKRGEEAAAKSKTVGAVARLASRYSAAADKDDERISSAFEGATAWLRGKGIGGGRTASTVAEKLRDFRHHVESTSPQKQKYAAKTHFTSYKPDSSKLRRASLASELARFSPIKSKEQEAIHALEDSDAQDNVRQQLLRNIRRRASKRDRTSPKL